MGNCCQRNEITVEPNEKPILILKKNPTEKIPTKQLDNSKCDLKVENESGIIHKSDREINIGKLEDVMLKPEKQLSNTRTMTNDKSCEIKIERARMNSKEFAVSPDLFVQLKTQNATQYYNVIEELGAGAYGKVSLIEHKASKMIRAMKCIKKKNAKPAKEKELFNEAALLRRLDHPNIIKLFELFQDAKYYYLITEYCSGGELFDRIQASSTFSEEQAAEYMRQLLSAVVYCHQQNIMHRDLKPENILFETPNATSSLKVIDFGVATKFEPGSFKTEKYGTPYYIAPEVIDKKYTEKCDVWSCGVIMYILLCGYPPFNGSSDKDIMARVKAGRFKFYEEDWGRVSNEAKDLITKMLTYIPAHRISSEEALNHEWFKIKKMTPAIDKQILVKLSNFSSKNKLRQAILIFIATQTASKGEQEELIGTFKALDLDNNGVLTYDELVKGYQKVYGYSKEEAEAEVKKIIKNIDMNLSNEIDFTEFVIAATDADKLLSKLKLEQAFKLFDEDGDGFLTKAELENAMGGIDLGEGIWEELMGEVDFNNDGKVDFREFVEYCSKKV